MKIYSEFVLGPVTARYLINDQKHVGLQLFPTHLKDRLAQKRASLKGEPFIDALPGSPDMPADAINPLVHLKLVGDPYPGVFAQGRTMLSGPTNDRFTLLDQMQRKPAVSRVVGESEIVTRSHSAEGLLLEHRLRWDTLSRSVMIETLFHNGSNQPMKLEMLSSFSLGGLAAFDPADAPERLRVHRFRSVWSAEGRLDTQTIEQLHLERSWSGSAVFSERFGQVGTMPVRGWFPFVAVEDVKAGVVWAANLAWPASWQMEVWRRHDDVGLAGGLADREFGHWMKTIAPGETLITPPATIACVAGTLDDACDELSFSTLFAFDPELPPPPQVESDLPIIFNEWCTTWGDPTHGRLIAIADRLNGTGVTYLVIDAGWYKTDGGNWSSSHGDWIANSRTFPDGLAATAAAIRERGLIPGLWFEMETMGSHSDAFRAGKHVLMRDGQPITVSNRHFWDLTDPAAIDYLSKRVIGTLRDCNFGYMKVDYNETVGIGCDDSDGQGEGLRKRGLAIHDLFKRIRTELPELVIENCSSGGHRLEPSMLGLTAMSSFSDAHELVEIPIIAANLQRLMQPRQSQIWAVLHAADSDHRLNYSLAATFLGRMCLSGEIDQLSAAQWAIVRKAIDLYKRCTKVIANGTSRLQRHMGESWRRPRGWQAMVRWPTDHSQLLVVMHAFADQPTIATIQLPPGDWRITNSLVSDGHTLANNELTWRPSAAFTGDVVLLRKA